MLIRPSVVVWQKPHSLSLSLDYLLVKLAGYLQQLEGECLRMKTTGQPSYTCGPQQRSSTRASFEQGVQ